MFSRVLLAAGVAALAIAAPASAKPDGDKGGGDASAARGSGNSGGGGKAAFQGGRGGGGGKAQSVERRGGGGFKAQSAERRGGGFNAGRAQRVERQQSRAPRMERQQQFRFADRQQGGKRAERAQNRVIERQQARGRSFERAQSRSFERQQARSSKSFERRQQARSFERQQARGSKSFERQQARSFERQQARGKSFERVQNRLAERQLRGQQGRVFDDRLAVRDLRRGERIRSFDNAFANNFVGYGCPPGLAAKGCMPPGQAFKAARIANEDAFRFSSLAAFGAAGQPILAPVRVVQYVGSPLSVLSGVVPLSSLPGSIQYFYPDSDDYYYRYGGSYLYRVERDNDLIDWILPMLAGGLMPGTMFPSAYNAGYSPGYTLPNWYGNSYAPDYYGWNSFYPDTQYVDYRYLNGNVYGVDPYSGMIQDVIPTYAYGYGVGQYLPASYGYYNLPTQYRSLYYDTPDYNYWYAPGAIYQVDPTSQLITSVASLLAPGLSIGQPLPMGYQTYNVPLSYRSTYYDTPAAWYRYNNGYIYQVDPTTQLVTAIVASILT